MDDHLAFFFINTQHLFCTDKMKKHNQERGKMHVKDTSKVKGSESRMAEPRETAIQVFSEAFT